MMYFNLSKLGIVLATAAAVASKCRRECYVCYAVVYFVLI